MQQHARQNVLRRIGGITMCGPDEIQRDPVRSAGSFEATGAMQCKLTGSMGMQLDGGMQISATAGMIALN